jgi:hypothetical protein
MHYWKLLCDWNTVESVRAVHSFFEGWALVFFALLVIFDVLAHLTEDEHRERSKALERIGLWCFGVAVIAEILAYPYSRRNDTLSSQQDETQKITIARLDNSTQGLRTDAQHSKERADTLATGLETERQKTARFQKDAAVAQSDLAEKLRLEEMEEAKLRKQADDELEARLSIEHGLRRALRHSPGEGGEKVFFDKIKPFAGQRINFIEYPNDEEVSELAGQVKGVLIGADWTVIVPPGTCGPPIFGIRVEVRDPPPGIVRYHQAAEALIRGLADNQLMISGPYGVFPGETSAGDFKLDTTAEITIIIGKNNFRPVNNPQP